MDSIGGEPEIFIDPNQLSDDGTVALTGIFMSHDGKYTAYTISRSGSDWTEIYVMETDSKKLLSDHIEWAKFTGASWKGDGFYYSAYDKPEAGKEFSSANEYHKVYYHKIGTPQSMLLLLKTRSSLYIFIRQMFPMMNLLLLFLQADKEMATLCKFLILETPIQNG